MMRWVLMLLLLADSAWAITGLQFPTNADVTDGETVRFKFANPHSSGLPIYGPSGAGVTYIWKIKPSQQTGYYTTFFWANDDGAGDINTFTWDSGQANTYYGAHPYPDSGNGSGTTHSWEISVAGGDTTGAAVVQGSWYTQVFQAVGASGDNKDHTFYWDWPNTDAGHTVTFHSLSGYGNANPPAPALTFGDAPWHPGAELCSCILRGIQIYNALLSEADIASEIASPLSTAAGAASIWYLNLNPTPTDITDKSGAGHDPSWVGANRPTLWSQADQSGGASGNVKFTGYVRVQ